MNAVEDENKWLEGDDCDDDNAKHGQICEFVNERMHKWNKIFKTIRFFLLRRRHVRSRNLPKDESEIVSDEEKKIGAQHGVSASTIYRCTLTIQWRIYSVCDIS